MVMLNCGECGLPDAAEISPSVVSGIVVCVGCDAGIDAAHAYGHAAWCTFCGVEVCDCECGEVV